MALESASLKSIGFKTEFSMAEVLCQPAVLSNKTNFGYFHNDISRHMKFL